MPLEVSPWIWYLVIQYLPDQILGNLISLNRVFFEYGMKLGAHSWMSAQIIEHLSLSRLSCGLGI